MEIALNGKYSDQVLFVAGLAAGGRSESYKLIDLAAGTVHEVRIGIDDIRERQLTAIVDGLSSAGLPYGHTAPEQLLSYFLHPHEFVQTAAGEIVVTFKQAPYVRVLGTAETRLWPPPEKLSFDRMLCSTAVESAPGVVSLTAVESAARFARYRGGESLFGCELLEFEPATNAERTVGSIGPCIRDTVHQLQYSPAGYYVGVDMNLTADVAATRFSQGADEPFDVGAYAQAPFPQSSFFVRDATTGVTTIVTPGTSCLAHAEFDPLHPEAFYVSCHNISKWRDDQIIHGPGTLEKYRWSQDGVQQLASFTDPGFLRITSLAPFERDGETMVAVTGYPNSLYLFDAGLNLVRRIILFDDETPRPPYVCPKGSAAPLYLAITENKRYVLLTGPSELFVVDLDAGALVDRVRFCEPGTFMATAHIDLVRRSAAVSRLIGEGVN